MVFFISVFLVLHYAGKISSRMRQLEVVVSKVTLPRGRDNSGCMGEKRIKELNVQRHALQRKS